MSKKHQLIRVEFSPPKVESKAELQKAIEDAAGAVNLQKEALELKRFKLNPGCHDRLIRGLAVISIPKKKATDFIKQLVESSRFSSVGYQKPS